MDWLFFTFASVLASVLASNFVWLVWNWILSAGRIAEEDRQRVEDLERRLEAMENSSRRVVETKLSDPD